MNPNYLDFEQPIADLEAKIEELRMVGNDTDINITYEISRLRKKSVSLTESIFSNLKPWDVARLARHPRRPYTLDYVDMIFDDFDESEIAEQPTSIRVAWQYGKELRTLYPKQNA